MQPSPLELMAFADDELDEPRASEVAQWLAEHPDEASALDMERDLYRLTGEASRAHFAAPASFDLGDSIMAAIASEPAVGLEVRGERRANDERDEESSTERQAPVESGMQAIRRVPAADVTPLPAPRAPAASLASRRAASRPLMVFGALVAAAAASLLWWRSSGLTTAYTPADGASQTTATALVASVLPADEDVVIGDDGAAITSVDFGAQSGAIFYVPGTSAASAVIWVDDNDGSP